MSSASSLRSSAPRFSTLRSGFRDPGIVTAATPSCAAVGSDLVLRCGQSQFKLLDLSEDAFALVDHDLQALGRGRLTGADEFDIAADCGDLELSAGRR